MNRTRTTTDAEFETGTSRDAAAVPEQIGRYNVLEQIGAGGMGTVYAAYDPQLDRKVALKVLHPPRSDASQHTHARARLLREAQAIAKVTHPNVIAVYEVGVVTLTDAQHVFLAMELVEGPTLRAWMEQLQTTEAWKRGHAWREIVEILVQAGRGLCAAHAAGLMHRDFKPDNILVGDDGLVRVVDFGLARRVRTLEEKTSDLDRSAAVDAHVADPVASFDEPLTVSGAVLGTPAYMAPEQFRGGHTDERTDQFALCLTLYEALWGVRAFDSSTANGLACAVMQGDMRPWPTTPPVPEHLIRILRRGLSREPDARFDSIEAVVTELEVDPARVRKQRMAWVGGGLALLTATSVGAALARRPEAAPADPCGAGPQRLAQRYDSTRASQLRAALQDPALPYASQTIEAVLSELEQYGTRWVRSYRNVCESTHLRHEQTGDLLDQRMACLDRRLTALDAIAAELTRQDQPSLLRDAAHIASSLPSPQPCEDMGAAQGAPQLDPATRDQVADAQKQLDIVSAKDSAYRFAEAAAMLVELKPEVDSIGDATLEAEYFLALGRARASLDELDASIEATRKAMMLAQAAAQDWIVRDAAALLAMLIGDRKAERANGLVWADLAEATAQRVGWTDKKRSVLLLQRAWLLAEWGMSSDAIEVAERALALAARADGTETLAMARAHSLVGSVYGRLGKLELAVAEFRADLTLIRKLLGDDHPALITTYLNLSNALAALHKTDAARESLDEALALARRVPGVSKRQRGVLQSSLGNLLLTEGRWDDALAPLRRALELREDLYGPDHPLLSRTLLGLGNAYTNTDRYDEGTAVYERALAIREAALGPDSPLLILILVNLGQHHVLHGQPSAALEPLERARALLTKHPQNGSSEAECTYWLGRALVETRTDRTRGLAMAEAAVAELTKAGRAGLANNATTWLATQP